MTNFALSFFLTNFFGGGADLSCSLRVFSLFSVVVVVIWYKPPPPDRQDGVQRQ